MPFRFPRRSIYGDGIIDVFSFDTLPDNGSLPGDPASVRFRSIAEIMLRGIQRCVAADREFDDESSENSALDEPVLGNLRDSLPEPLAFVSDKALSVSRVSKTLGFGDAQDIQNGDNS
ncbi:MAG: hypothetical protein KDB22_08460 [Planctomycetales bacterium]|nr:hypothetical protein [Planctomycetales bacterium]